MPSAAMNRLLDDAKASLPGALESAILAEMFRATREFTDKTNVWTRIFDIEVTPTQLSRAEDPDAYVYRIIPPTGARSRRLLSVTNADGGAIAARMVRPDYIELASSPDEPQVYRAEVTLMVTDPTTRDGEPLVPDWIIENYTDILLHGLLYRMMGQPAKPYSSVSLATYHSGMFKSGISTTRIQVDHGRVKGGQAWRFPRTFNR